MQHQAELRRCLIDCDVAQLRKLWAHIAPQWPQPKTERDMLVALHIARTNTNGIPFRARAYSHRWLIDGGWPSGLPDHLKPKAERIYPRVVGAVGISSMGGPGVKTHFNRAIEKVMGDAVLETYADGHENQPHIVKARMMEKRAEFKRRA
jgi:hypothetical protein